MEDEDLESPEKINWDEGLLARKYLTGSHILQAEETTTKLTPGAVNLLSSFPGRTQELLLVQDILWAMMGINGDYVKLGVSDIPLAGDEFIIVDNSVDISVHPRACRLLPLCKDAFIIRSFIEEKSHYRRGFINNALAAALHEQLDDLDLLRCELEDNFLHGELWLQEMWLASQDLSRAFHLLANLAQQALQDKVSGAALLDLIHDHVEMSEGDNASMKLLRSLQEDVRAPYYKMLEVWLAEGVLTDPEQEFLIQEDKSVIKESLVTEHVAQYWQRRYSLAVIPRFLEAHATKILLTGKYLNAIKETGHQVRVPKAPEVQLGMGGISSIQRMLDVAYEYASREFLGYVMSEFDLMRRLQTVKNFFLLAQGDYLAHFMDIAKDELKKFKTSLRTLQPLLELAVRSSVGASDPYIKDLACDAAKMSVARTLLKVSSTHHIDRKHSPLAPPGSDDSKWVGDVSGWNTFQLTFKVSWPLSLILSRDNLSSYQILFRHLFHCKHMEAELNAAWQAHQVVKRFDLVELKHSRIFCQELLHFVKNLYTYCTMEVLELSWQRMRGAIQTAASVDEVMEHHSHFLTKSLAQCGLLDAAVVKEIIVLLNFAATYCGLTRTPLRALEDLAIDQAARRIHSGASAGPRRQPNAAVQERERKVRPEAKDKGPRAEAKLLAAEEARRFASGNTFGTFLVMMGKAERDFHGAYSNLLEALKEKAQFVRLAQILTEARAGFHSPSSV